MREPRKYSEAIRDKLKAALEEKYSTIEGKKQDLLINNITFDPIADPDDYERHKKAIFGGKTDGINLYADVTLKDKISGKIADEKKHLKLGLLPTVTNRHSFLINGKEYIVHNQFRLLPGIYTKLDRNDLPVADFNLAKGKNMNLMYMPAKERLMLKVGGSYMPLYSLLKGVYNVPDNKLVKAFGRDMHESEMEKFKKDGLKGFQSLNRVLIDKPTGLGAIHDITAKLDQTVMDPELNEMTIGKNFDRVNADSVLEAARQVMQIHRGEINPSGKDNLAFKSVHSAEDFTHEKFTKLAGKIHSELRSKIDNAGKISDILLPRTIGRTIDQFFVHSNLVNYPVQVNPMEMLENSHKITSLGEGAIEDTNSLSADHRNLDLSHMGYIDIVRTPDNMRAGVDVRTSMGAWKEGNELKTYMFNRKGGIEERTPKQNFHKLVAVLNEAEVAPGLFRAFYQGKMVEVPKNKIDYFVNPDYMFTTTTGSIPFLNTNQGQRCAMGAKMQTQAVSLIHREAPLVSTAAHQLIADSFVPKARMNGTVEAIEKGKIIIKDGAGILHNHNLPDNFPLNYHSYLHVDPLVKVGDTVKKGQVLGDHNFSSKGALAIGKNLDVAYLPMKGFNFDDAIVITQQGADKLASSHIFQYELEIPDASVNTNVDHYRSHFSNRFNLGQLGHLQGNIVKVGQKVNPGDPLIVAMKRKSESPEVLMVGKMINRMTQPYNDVAITWDKDFPGEIIEVINNPKDIKVIVRATAPMVVANKLCGRYGNKGVVGQIIENHLAPHKADESIPDVIMNPSGVPSRMNDGQVHETFLGKIIKATDGKPINYRNFSGENAWDKISALAAKHGIKANDQYYDPVTGKELSYIDPKTGKKTNGIFNGTQYIMQLFKDVDSGFSARAAGRYDIDLRPVKGGPQGSKAIGALDMYALLGNNSRALLREASTYKSEFNPEFWSAILQGQPLPPPKVPFVFEKLQAMMQGMGVNLKKEGNSMKLLPFTDKDILKMSSGEISEPKTVITKPDKLTGLPFRPETGGLFDPAKTGGLKGKNWTHINLAVPVVNVMFEKPIRALLNLKQEDFEAISTGQHMVEVGGQSLTGGAAIKAMLSGINPEADIKRMVAEIESTKSKEKKNSLLKKVKYLKAVHANGIHPADAYILNKLPVIPPIFRPIYPDEKGDVVVSDANHLYRNILDFNEQMKSPLMKATKPDDPGYMALHKGYFDAVKQLQGLDGTTEQVNGFGKREPKGFFKVITGSASAKYGFYQGKISSRVQDIAGRGVAAPNPAYGIDECGLPEPMAWELYKPFVIGQLVKSGYALPKATEEVENQTAFAKKALLAEMKERPVFLNRAPSLHKFNMTGAIPHLIQGKQILVCPLINKGLNLDYDGDNLTVHLPVSPEGIKEVFGLLPSNNLFNPLNRNPMFMPDQEAIMGLYQITTPLPNGKVHKFGSKAEVLAAYKAGKIHINDRVEVTI